jgi:hypothetical protein
MLGALFLFSKAMLTGPSEPYIRSQRERIDAAIEAAVNSTTPCTNREQACGLVPCGLSRVGFSARFVTFQRAIADVIASASGWIAVDESTKCYADDDGSVCQPYLVRQRQLY